LISHCKEEVHSEGVAMNEGELFIAVVQIESAAERSAYLDQACAGDALLRQRLDGLLNAFAQAGSFLQRPAPAPGATVDASPAGSAINCAPIEAPGTVIGPYHLMEQIGEGGMGLVFVAEQQHPVRRKVALKVIKPGMDTRQVIARFEAERQALALMDHPNIARVLDGGETASGRPFFVMELVKGVPITQFCDDNRLSPRQRLELFVSVCQAVQHAHQKGIIHRDVKPSNVLVVSHDGVPVVKVIDFGVAKAVGQQLTDKTVYTHFAQLVGTPLYMSPEQAGQSGLDVDTRSDIYSLGVLLYELLTGTTPFDKERFKDASYDEIRRIVREEEPARPSTRISTLGQAASTVSAKRQSDPRHLSRLLRGELDWIVMKALEKDRSRRYETASAFAADVERYLNDEPVQACPPSVSYRLRKFVRRNKAVLTTAAVVSGALLLGAVLSLWQAARATAEQARTQAALTAEAKRRQQTRAALDAMSSEFIKEWLAKQTRLLPGHKAFLERALSYYEEFASDTDQDEESRLGVALAYHRVAEIHELLGQRKEAEAAYLRTLDLYAALSSDFPGKPNYRHFHAEGYHDLAVRLKQSGRLVDAEAAYRQALGMEQQLVNEFPTVLFYRQGLAATQGNLASLLKATNRITEAEAAYRQLLVIDKQLVEEGSLPAYRQGLATTHFNLGNLLKDAGEAETAYRQALAIQRQLLKELPNEPQYSYDLAGSLGNLGMLLADKGEAREAEKADRESLAICEKLVHHFPGVPAYRQGLATSYYILGNLLMNTGRAPEAEEINRKALAIQKQLADEFADVPTYRRDLARTYVKLGAPLAGEGDTPDAEAAYRQALSVQDQLVKDFPAIPAYRQDLALLHDSRGQLLRTTGRPAEAEPAYRQALAILKQLAKEFPKMPEYQQDSARILGHLGEVLVDCRKPQEAEDAYNQALANWQRLENEFPGKPAYQKGSAEMFNDLAILLQANRRLPEAEEAHGRSLAKWKNLADKSPRWPAYQQGLASGYTNLGNLLSVTSRRPEGEKLYCQALVVFKQLVHDYPLATRYRNDLAAGLCNIAIALRARKEFAEARRLLDEALPHHQAALKAHPRHPNYRRCYRNNRALLARTLVALKQHATAAEAAGQLLDTAVDPARDAYYATCCLSLCVSLAERDEHLGEPERRQRALAYGDRAVAALRHAIQNGLKNAAQLKKDPDLNPLRGRDDFQKLVRELEDMTDRSSK
jgi:serine/threonine protein kinase/tetratricopeptide (TPR) repeat protein